MVIRKLNAGFGLATTALTLVHAILLAIWMLSRGSIANTGSVLSWILTGVAVIHALLTVYVMISTHRGQKDRRGRTYPQLIRSTIVQRVSGVLLVVFTWLHVAGAAGFMQPPQVVHAIVPPLFFTVVMAHIAISTSKAFITLGIGNAKVVKTVDIVVKVLCGVTLIADIIGFYLHVV